MAKQSTGKLLLIGGGIIGLWFLFKDKIAEARVATLGYTQAEKKAAADILIAAGTPEAEIKRILAEAKPSAPITQQEWVKQVAESWQAIPGNVAGGATARTLADAGIAPSTGAIGQAQYQVNQAVFALPGGKDNPQFRELVEQGLSAQQALEMMSQSGF